MPEAQVTIEAPGPQIMPATTAEETEVPSAPLAEEEEADFEDTEDILEAALTPTETKPTETLSTPLETAALPDSAPETEIATEQTPWVIDLNTSDQSLTLWTLFKHLIS